MQINNRRQALILRWLIRKKYFKLIFFKYLHTFYNKDLWKENQKKKKLNGQTRVQYTALMVIA